MPARRRHARLASVSLLAAFVLACTSGGSSRASSGGPAGSAKAAMGDVGATTASATGAHRADDPAGVPTGTLSGAHGAPGQGPAARRIQTVFLVLLENKTWSEVKGSRDAPYLNGTLLPRASIAEGYRAARNGGLHPSEPNYVWLEAGDNLGITNDDDPERNHQATPDHLVNLLEKAGVSWRSYQEDIGGDVCPLRAIGEYEAKHDPMVFFDDVTDKNNPKAARCIEHVRPLSELERDLSSGKVARYNFITPNECNDMHTSCEPLRNVIKQGDDWLAKWMPKILRSRAYEQDGAVLVTWDEAEIHLPDCLFADCPVGLFVLSPLAKGRGYTNQLPYDHSSTLRTVQEIFGVSPLLRGASTAQNLSDLFSSFP